MILMGIDQSLTNSGVTIYNGSWRWSLIQTEKTKGTKAPSIDYTRRLIEISNKIGSLIKENNVEYIAMEGLAFGSQGQVIFDIGGLSHTLRMKFVELNIPFIIVPPTTLKKYWFGKGNAKKEDMLQATINKGFNISITKNYGTKKEPDIRMDDNVVDSHALCVFLKDLLENNLSNDFINMVEYSKNVFIK